MNVKTYIKLTVFGLLKYLPGSLGVRFETAWLREKRKRPVDQALAEFESTLASLPPGAICIDLGANIGEVTKQLAQHAHHVHAFEPDPWAFGKLRENMASFTNVTLHNAAIGVRDGTLTMMREPGFEDDPASASIGTSSFHSTLWKSGDPGVFEAEQVDFLRFLRELDQKVAVLKVDIEGAEVELLEALIGSPELDLVDKVYVETHEIQMPELRPRLKALRQRLSVLTHPQMNLDWY